MNYLLSSADCAIFFKYDPRFFTLTDSANNAAIEELKKQVNDIIQELNLLKEQQALQTGIIPSRKFLHKCLGVLQTTIGTNDIRWQVMGRHLRDSPSFPLSLSERNQDPRQVFPG